MSRRLQTDSGALLPLQKRQRGVHFMEKKKLRSRKKEPGQQDPIRPTQSRPRQGRSTRFGTSISSFHVQAIYIFVTAVGIATCVSATTVFIQMNEYLKQGSDRAIEVCSCKLSFDIYIVKTSLNYSYTYNIYK